MYSNLISILTRWISLLFDIDCRFYDSYSALSYTVVWALKMKCLIYSGECWSVNWWRMSQSGETFKCIIAALSERVEGQHCSSGALHRVSPSHLQAVPEEWQVRGLSECGASSRKWWHSCCQQKQKTNARWLPCHFEGVRRVQFFFLLNHGYVCMGTWLDMTILVNISAKVLYSACCQSKCCVTVLFCIKQFCSWACVSLSCARVYILCSPPSVSVFFFSFFFHEVYHFFFKSWTQFCI